MQETRTSRSRGQDRLQSAVADHAACAQFVSEMNAALAEMRARRDEVLAALAVAEIEVAQAERDGEPSDGGMSVAGGKVLLAEFRATIAAAEKVLAALEEQAAQAGAALALKRKALDAALCAEAEA